jgi:zinc/manganese transport system substrate-binding protein
VRMAATATVLLLVVSLAGCSGAGAESSPPGTVDVVASTSVWGDIASEVGGRWVSVTSIVSRPDQDPHSFEGSARTLLAVTKADLLVRNGGGYDDFMGQLIDSADTSAPVIDAVALSGVTAPPGGELNEHVWYDLRATDKVADAIASRLSVIAPRHSADFRRNARQFASRVERLMAAERRVAAAHEGEGVGITEPVPLYLLSAMGLHNLTPVDFSRAVEDGGDVPARVLAETLDLYHSHRVAALVYNSQTSSPITEQVKQTAEAAGVAVVPVTETMPTGETYLSWMRHTIAAISRAVSTS